MTKDIMKKSFVLIIFVITIISFFNTSSYAGAVDSFTGSLDNAGEAKGTITNIITEVLAAVRTLGVSVAIVMLMYIGAKYMLASAGDKAEIKKYAMNYVVGALIMFGAAGIMQIIKTAVDSATATTTE